MKYTNPAHRHPWLLQAKVVAPPVMPPYNLAHIVNLSYPRICYSSHFKTDGSIYSHVQTCPVVLSPWRFYHGYNLSHVQTCLMTSSPCRQRLTFQNPNRNKTENKKRWNLKKAPLREGPNYFTPGAPYSGSLFLSCINNPWKSQVLILSDSGVREIGLNLFNCFMGH